MKLSFYHITCAKNVESILASGLVPRSPKVSTVESPMVYVHRSIGGLLNLRQQQVDEGDKSGGYAVLEVRVNPENLQPDPDTDEDGLMTDQAIPPRDVTVQFYGWD